MHALRDDQLIKREGTPVSNDRAELREVFFTRERRVFLRSTGIGTRVELFRLEVEFSPLHIGIDLRYGDYVLSDYDIVSYDECAVAGGVRTVGHLSPAEWH